MTLTQTLKGDLSQNLLEHFKVSFKYPKKRLQFSTLSRRYTTITCQINIPLISDVIMLMEVEFRLLSS